MASKQTKLGVPKSGGGSPVVSVMTQKAQFPVDSQSQEISFRELKEFIKEAMNNQTAAMNNQTVIMEGKCKEFVEDINAIKDVEGKHNEIRDKVGDIMIKTEKVDDELVGFQELLNSFTSALLESIDRTFQKYNLEQKEAEINQPNMTLEDKQDLAEAFTQLIEKQQIDSLLQTDKSYQDNSWFYRRRNELTHYTSKKSRYGGSKSEEITLKIHQPQIKIQKLFKRKVGGKKKHWKKYRKKGRMED